MQLSVTRHQTSSTRSSWPRRSESSSGKSTPPRLKELLSPQVQTIKFHLIIKENISVCNSLDSHTKQKGTDGDIQLASIGAMSEQAPTPSTASRKPPRKPSTPRSSSQNNGATPGIPSSSTPRSRQTASRKRTSKKLSTTTTSTPAAIEDAINDSISSTINELVNSAATNS